MNWLLNPVTGGVADEAGSADAPAASGGTSAGTEQGKQENAQEAPKEPPKATRLGESTQDTEQAPKDEQKAEQPEQPGSMQEYIDKHSQNSPAVSLALEFLQNQGINPRDPAFVAAEVDGDFTHLEAILAQKGAPGAANMVAILQKAVSDHQAKVEKFNQERDGLFDEMLGEHREAIINWASETASDEEKEPLNDMLEAGGLYARAALHMLKEMYGQSNNTRPAKSAVTTAQPMQSNAGLTASEYAQEVQKLSREMRGNIYASPKYAELTRRREVSRKQEARG